MSNANVLLRNKRLFDWIKSAYLAKDKVHVTSCNILFLKNNLFLTLLFNLSF